MTMSTKALLALLSVGGVTYAIHRNGKKKKAEESKKRREAKTKKAA
jgi:hypothetical protein